MQFTGGTLFVDHCTKFMFIYNQSFGFAVSNYHGDNGIFKTQTFMDDYNRKQQQITFSGTGAHHQNGVAERSFQTIVGWARMLLLRAAIHWP